MRDEGTVRILTWNVERGRNVAGQQALLDSFDADIEVLTEVPAGWSRHLGSTVFSPARRAAGEAWVAITSRHPIEPALDIPYERLAAAALVELPMVTLAVYGSVLPWYTIGRQNGLLGDRERYGDAFARYVAEQSDDLASLRALSGVDAVIWAGDFNQSLIGPCWGGSGAGRQMVTEALERLGIVAWNMGAPHRRPGMSTIDLICGPAVTVDVHYFDPVVAGREVSDHAGYYVDLDFPWHG